MKRYTLNFTEPQLERLQKFADRLGIGFSEGLRRIIDDALGGGAVALVDVTLDDAAIEDEVSDVLKIMVTRARIQGERNALAISELKAQLAEMHAAEPAQIHAWESMKARLTALEAAFIAN